jgi:hypothetical protein
MQKQTAHLPKADGPFLHAPAAEAAVALKLITAA